MSPSSSICSRFPALLLPIALFSVGCGSSPRVVRGSEEPGIDVPAFGTGLDKRDLDEMLQKNLAALWRAPVVARWHNENRPTVSILAIHNETSEHIESSLRSLISDFETELINSGRVRVVSLENQPELMQEVRNQQGDGFDPTQVARWGKQLGVRYVVTGKVFSVDERAQNARRVQYALFMQVLDVETSEVLFQNKADTTKAIVND